MISDTQKIEVLKNKLRLIAKTRATLKDLDRGIYSSHYCPESTISLNEAYNNITGELMGVLEAGIIEEVLK